jgi:hypothetical protein
LYSFLAAADTFTEALEVGVDEMDVVLQLPCLLLKGLANNILRRSFK